MNFPALTMSDRIAVFHDGRIQQLADPVTLYNEPSNRFVASFIGENNTLPCTLVSREGDQAVAEMADGTRLRAMAASGAGAKAGAGSEPTISVRPENVVLGEEIAGAEANRFTGRVQDVFFLGDHIRLSVEAFGGQAVTARIPTRDARPFARGDEVLLGCRVRDCRLLEL